MGSVWEYLSLTMAEFIAITPIKFFCHTHTHTYPHTHPHIPTHPPTHTHMHTLRMTEALTLSKNIMALSAQTLLMAGNVQGGGSKLIFELVRVLYCQLVHQHHYHLSLSPSPSSLFPPTGGDISLDRLPACPQGHLSQLHSHYRHILQPSPSLPNAAGCSPSEQTQRHGV